jgi:hypothetical protein
MHLSPDDVVQHLTNPDSVVWTTMAHALVVGHQSCVDGRDQEAVLGTPGGDAGEYLLFLATIERLTQRPLDDAQIPVLFDRFMLHFGTFYMHTDRLAVEALATALGADPAFADVGPTQVERLLQDPGDKAEALLPHLLQPAHIGCGHLRLILEHPEEYGVRPDLARAVLSTVFRRLWSGADIDYVVLEGGHAEGAVVKVHIDKPKHPYTRIPMVTPFDGTTQFFVAHPEATVWMRQQMALFLCEELPMLGCVDAASFAFEVNGLASVQLRATLAYLANGLPVYDALVDDDGGVEVT